MLLHQVWGSREVETLALLGLVPLYPALKPPDPAAHFAEQILWVQLTVHFVHPQ